MIGFQIYCISGNRKDKMDKMFDLFRFVPWFDLLEGGGAGTRSALNYHSNCSNAAGLDSQ